MTGLFWGLLAATVVLLLGVWATVNWGVERVLCRWLGHDDVREVDGRTLRLRCLRCRRQTEGVTVLVPPSRRGA